ncbi:hypothetical protein BKA70DRAFT_1226021 [Coprinopsis sp. MPI-PUGE-AT-0042]|nr:hypothetical protein BKA70DRAFT_1226021 [Coprinopsis sp. MPI-PUGE-AT-0042]
MCLSGKGNLCPCSNKERNAKQRLLLGSSTGTRDAVEPSLSEKGSDCARDTSGKKKEYENDLNTMSPCIVPVTVQDKVMLREAVTLATLAQCRSLLEMVGWSRHQGIGASTTEMTIRSSLPDPSRVSKTIVGLTGNLRRIPMGTLMVFKCFNVADISVSIHSPVQQPNVQHRLSYLFPICFHPCFDTALRAYLALQAPQLFKIPPREHPPETLAPPWSLEDDADPPNADSSSTNTTVLVNLRTLGLDSVLPHNSPDFTIAAVKLGRASRARAEVLHEVDRAVEDLQVLVDSFNNTNENVAFSASLYEAVRHYHSCPKISQVMTDLVNALHPLEVSQT